MIIFIAPNPRDHQEREGFMQRVSTIDETLDDNKKIYFDDIPEGRLAEYFNKADLVYVHSIYQAAKILPFYKVYGHKIVTDLHGVVPEEEDYYGNHDKSLIMTEVEKEVFDNCQVFIAVTESMVSHYQKKYKLTNNVKWIVLPIFTDTNTKKNHQELDENSVIYAGGTQPWQRIEDMIYAIENSPERFNFTILTHDRDAFKKIGAKVTGRINILTVTNAETTDYYSKSAFGFVLRDNSIVNKVACPTKLIEYISNGVVPIVSFEDIGDFKKMGYKYINVKDFILGNIKRDFIDKAIAKNYEVLENLKSQTQKGKDELKIIHQNFTRTKSKNDGTYLLASSLASDIVRLNIDNRVLQSAIDKLAENLETINNEHIALETQYKSIINSKRWRLVDRAAKVRNRFIKK